MFNRKLVVSSLIKLAKRVQAFDNDTEEEAKALDFASRLDALVRPALDNKAIKEAQKALDEAEKIKKEAEKTLKDAFKEFDAQTGYSKMMDALTAEIDAFEKAGGNLEKIASACKIAKRKSLQPSYKEWLMVVVSTLNEAEIRKYLSDTLGAFKKEMLEVKTGISVLDRCLKEWSDEAVAISDEREVPLPKASVHPKAGLLDFFKKVGVNLVKLLKDVFGPVIDWAKGLTRKMKATTDKAEAFNGKIEKLARQADRF